MCHMEGMITLVVMGVGGMGCHGHDVILIRDLWLYSNQISVLPENVFSGLTNLW